MKKIFENAVWWSGVIMVGLILGVSLQFVRAWTEPGVAPPDGNVGAPINTSSFYQIKAGVIGAVGLVTNSFQLATGAKPGYVLTSDAFGNATWLPPSGGGSTQRKVEFTSDGTWICPPGVTAVTVQVIGGGGGGGGSSTDTWGNLGGGAGAVNSYNNIAVVPGTTYDIKVGKGGQGGDNSGSGGSSGEGSSFGVSGQKPVATANGGKGTDKATTCNGGNTVCSHAGGSNGTGYGSGGYGADDGKDCGSPITGNGCGPGVGGSSGTNGYVMIQW